MDKYLKVSNLSKTYIGGYNGIKQVNFDLDLGEKLAICGSEGSGKTTVLSLLAGAESATTGEIFLDNQNILNSKIKNRNIGYIDKSLQLSTFKKVKDIICYPLKLRKFDNNIIATKLDEIAKMLEIKDLLDVKIANLSYYQKVVVAIARLAILDRKLYLIDDIFDSLNAEEIVKISNFISKVFAEKTLIIAFTNTKICKNFAINKLMLLGYGTSLGCTDIHEKEIFLKTIEGAKLIYDRKVCCIPCELKDGKICILGKEYDCNFKLKSEIFVSCSLLLQMDKVRFDSKGKCRISVNIDYINEDNIGYFDIGYKIATIALDNPKYCRLGKLNFSFDIDDGILYDYESERRIST